MAAGPSRLYLAPPLAAGKRVLDAERSHYLVRVLRLKPGAAVVCFDGAGSEWQARLIAAAPRAAELSLELQRARKPAPRVRVHLACSWLKGQAMDLVVQKATELGVSDIWPLMTTRGNVKLDPARVENRLAHWRRILVSASEQSGRSHLPVLHAPVDLATLLRAPPCPRLVLLDPQAAPLPNNLPRESLALLVGPEGGWDPGERRAAEAAGARVHGLGPLVLRAETAPLAALAGIRHSWGWRLDDA